MRVNIVRYQEVEVNVDSILCGCVRLHFYLQLFKLFVPEEKMASENIWTNSTFKLGMDILQETACIVVDPIRLITLLPS